MNINRKASTGNQIMIFQYIFLFVVVAVGFYIGLSLFFGQGYDFRQIEADLLSYNIQECISENSQMDWNNLFSICKLDKDKLLENNLYFRICENITFSECATNSNYLVNVGSNFEVCFFAGAKENYDYPKCSLKKISYNQKDYFLITLSNQKVKEVLE